MNKTKEIEALIKEELEELKEYYAYGSGIDKRGDEHFLYSIHGLGFVIDFYEWDDFCRLWPGVMCHVYTKYKLYGFVDFKTNLNELRIIDKIKAKLDDYVERRAKNNEKEKC